MMDGAHARQRGRKHGPNVCYLPVAACAPLAETEASDLVGQIQPATALGLIHATWHACRSASTRARSPSATALACAGGSLHGQQWHSTLESSMVGFEAGLQQLEVVYREWVAAQDSFAQAHARTHVR